jgi:hypothetical protein
MHKMPKMKKFPVSVPLELHTRFKIKCAREGTLMSEVVRKLLERECGIADVEPAKPTIIRRPRKSQPEEANA